jgi:hypothetical protein
MDFSFSEEQEALRDLARQIFSDHADPERLRRIETSADGVDHALWRSLAGANLLGLALPEVHGGAALGLTEIGILLEEQGRALAPVPLLATIVLGALPVARFGTPEQCTRLLPGVATGETILTAALSEHACFDPTRPRTRAKRQGDGWRLDGEKICVPAGHLAERILVPARTEGDGLGVFLVDPRAPGIALERQHVTNHEAQVRLTLTDAPVPAADVLGASAGSPARGAEIVRFIEARTLVGLCSLQLGVAEEALRRTAEYTSVRKQFGRPIGAFQGVSLRAADAYIDVEAMRSTLWQAVWRLDAGMPAEMEVGVAKWWACRGGQRVVHTAQHLHGGTGADIEYPIHRFFLWSKQLDLSLGGASVQLARLGALLAQDAAQEARG